MFAGLVALTVVSTWTHAARAQDEAYAVVEIFNVTDEFNVNYSLRWGTDPWKPYTVKKGGSYYHYLKLKSANDRSAPKIEISFNPGVGKPRSEIGYDLEWNVTPVKNQGGKPYHFKIRTDNNGTRFVELYSGNGGQTQVVVAKSTPTTSNATGLPGSTWIGTETLAGYGELSFKFGENNDVSMIDKDGTTQGTWKQAGKNVTLNFGKKITYIGTLEGDTIKGTATNEGKNWDFTVSNSNFKATSANLAQQGRELTEKGLYDQALAKFDEHLKLNPKDAYAVTNKAFVYLQKGDYEKALEECDAALKINPKVSNAFNVRGLVYVAQQKFDEAIKEHGDAVAINSKDPVLLSNRGLAYAGKKEWEPAIKDYSDALALAANNANYFVWRGNAYVGLRSYERAIADYSEAIRLQPNRPWHHNARGLAYFHADRLAEAIADYNEATRLDPKYAPAIGNRGAAYYKKKDYNRTIEECTEAIRINPKLDRAYWWRSQAYNKLQQKAEAKRDYEKAIELDARNQQLAIDVEIASSTVAPVANRAEALRMLRTFRLGSTLSSEELLELNSFPQLNYAEKLQNPVSDEVRQLIQNEKTRLEKLELEMVAAAYKFMTVTRLSPAAQQAEGVTLDWLYGPVTSVTDRLQSQDDLGGMRLIGRLVFNDGREITTIFPVTFFPNIDADTNRGRPGILWGADNFRIIAKLYKNGAPKSEFAHQSFSISNKDDGTQSLRGGLNISEDTGMLVDPYIRGSALGTRCMDCHAKGTNLNLKGDNKYYNLMRSKNYDAMKGFKDFLKLATEQGASKVDLAELEESMRKDPSLLLPVDEILRATEEYWVRRFPEYKKRIAAKGIKTSFVPNSFHEIRDFGSATPGFATHHLLELRRVSYFQEGMKHGLYRNLGVARLSFPL